MNNSIDWRTAAGRASMVAILAFSPVSQQAWAQNGADEDTVIEEVVSIGTRSPGRVASDSPVPVDSLSAESLSATGATEVGRMLQVLAPSFNFSSSTISDGTDALRPATLRGLGPDQTLVLVNGKRRHGSALIHVNTSVGRGAAGTDLNAIPVSSIKRIEVLRDGAAAQYGSDAIAGVINIVLKDYDEGGQVGVSYGEYSEGDGETVVVSYNQGLRLGNDGFLNFDVEYRDRGASNRAGLSGQCQFVCTDVNMDGVLETTDQREIDFNRLNFRIGDAESEQLAVVANLGIPLSNGSEFYGFLTYSARENSSGGFYRRANQASNNPTVLFDGVTPVNNGDAFVPLGYSPTINTDVDDFSLNAGVKGEFANGWGWDASIGVANNDFSFFISDSLNASLVSATGSSPRSADSGTLSLGLLTLDFDMFKEQDWGGLAVGLSYREDSYEIEAGEENSWRDFDTDAMGVNLGPSNATGGIQVFPGFRPENALDEDRDAVSAYVDIEYDAIDRWLLGGALRYEDYSDFGSTANVKFTAAFDATDTVRLRGAVSTGFRAPSLQQQFFNATSIQFVTGPGGGLVAARRGTFRNDSALASAIGIPQLEEETSTSFSFGVVIEPEAAWTLAIDYYDIQIDDRIVISGGIGLGLDPVLDAALNAAGATQAQFFLNAADTSTSGIDFVATTSAEGAGGTWDFSLAANFTETDIDSVRAPSSLSSIPGIQDLVFTSQDRSIVTEWQPEDRINFTTNFSRSNYSLNFGINRYGEYTVEEGGMARQTFGAKILVDTQFRYEFDNGLVLKVGGNNIFDEVPDTNTIGQSRTGSIVDGAGNLIVDSPGVFVFSRRAAPFGFNGAYYYAGADFSF